ncbi:MAG: hypothetical protein ACOX1S_15580 [Anaerostipes sp.]|jgi:hypothetical protein
MKKWVTVIPYVIFVIGIFMDIGVNLTGVSCVTVTESYMDYIFAAMISVSVLCFSFIALIAGFLEKKYYGYKLREIIQFPHSLVRMKKYIVESLVAIAIGVGLLAGNFNISLVNGMTNLLIALVVMEGIVAFHIFDVLTDPQKVYEIVTKYFEDCTGKQKMNYESFRHHTDRMMDALTTCIESHDITEKNNICEMLMKLANQVKAHKGDEDYETFYDFFSEKIRSKIKGYTLVFGYNEMLDLVVRIYEEIGDCKFDRIDYYLMPLEEIKFGDDRFVLENDYFNQISEIDLLQSYKDGLVSNDQLEKIFYVYLENIMDNNIISEKVRNKLVERYIRSFSRMHWVTNQTNNSLDVNVLLNLLKCKVLKNINVEERNYFYKLLIQYAFYNNQNDNEKYYDYLMYMFQAFYAYIYCEREALNPGYRKQLEETFELEFSSETMARMSAPILIERNIESLLYAIGRRIVAGKEFDDRRFEYFPGFTMVKSVIWTREFNVEYYFLMYVIFYDDVFYHDVYKGFIDIEGMSNEEKEALLKCLQDFFEFKTSLLKASFLDECRMYGKTLNATCNITEQEQTKLFTYISTEYASLKRNMTETQEPNERNVIQESVMQRINDLMEKDHIFGWNASYKTDTYIKFQMPDRIYRKSCRNEQTVARSIQHGIIESVRKYVACNSVNVELSFDLDGVEKLLDIIKTDKYDATNYIYTNDFALENLREEPKYIELEEQEKKLEYIKTPQFHQYIYWKKEKFVFNVKLSKMEIREMSDLECANYLENDRCYNGLYNVDGALMPKHEAMDQVKKIYGVEHYAFKILVGMGRDDVARIEFIH